MPAYRDALTSQHAPSAARRLSTHAGSARTCSRSYKTSEPMMTSKTSSSASGARLGFVVGVGARSSSRLQSSARAEHVAAHPFSTTLRSSASNSGSSKSLSVTDRAPSLAASMPHVPTPAPTSSTVFPRTVSGARASRSLSVLAAFHNLAPTPFASAVSNTRTSMP